MIDYNIKDLIPQREPFIMIDKLVDYDKKSFTSSLEIKPDNFFVEDGLFQEGGILENIAQTAAAGAGYSFVSHNKEVKLGYIGAIKNVEIHSYPSINSTITTQIDIITKVLNVDIVKGQVFDEKNNLLASCEMKIFIGE